MFKNLRDFSVSSVVCLLHAARIMRSEVSASEISISLNKDLGRHWIFLRVTQEAQRSFRSLPSPRSSEFSTHGDSKLGRGS